MFPDCIGRNVTRDTGITVRKLEQKRDRRGEGKREKGKGKGKRGRKKEDGEGLKKWLSIEKEILQIYRLSLFPGLGSVIQVFFYPLRKKKKFRDMDRA